MAENKKKDAEEKTEQGKPKSTPVQSDDQTAHVIDVSRPGSSKPSSTSRPIIVGSGKMIQDPMVKSSDKTDEKTEDSSSSSEPSSGSERVIKPLSGDENATSNTVEAKEVADNKAEPEEDTPAEEAAKDNSKKVDNKDQSSNKDEKNSQTTPQDTASEGDDKEKSESAIVDAVVDQATNNKNTTKKEAKTTDQHLQSLIDEKKYFVRIGKKRQKRAESIIIFISITAIVAMAVVVANEYQIISLW